MSVYGDRIKQARIARGMSQQALADAVGTSKQNIFKYETGIITNIPLDRIEALAAVLGVDPISLLGWNDDPSPTRLPTSADEERLLNLWRNADDTIRPVVLELLELHPRPDAKKGEA